MKHRYNVGQVLDLRFAQHNANRTPGPCEVVSCMPHDRGPLLYRVRSMGQTRESVVDEVDLSPSNAVRPTRATADHVFSIAVTKR